MMTIILKTGMTKNLADYLNKRKYNYDYKGE